MVTMVQPRKTSRIEETAFPFQDRIMFNVLCIQPMVYMVLMTKDYSKENQQCKITEKTGTKVKCFRNPPKCHLPATHGQSGDTDKEHAGIYYKQEEYTVL